MAHRGWRRDGFTPAKKAKAIEALEKCGNVADAARAAGVSSTTFYRHLAKDPDFAKMCELSRSKAARPLETLAWQRAVEGTPETIIRGGEIVQIRLKPSDSMMRLLLQATMPKKYGRLSRGGPTRRQIEKQLRKRIEAEVRAEIAAERAAKAGAGSLFDELAARVREIKGEAKARGGGEGIEGVEEEEEEGRHGRP